jgi:hypothetical protein
MQQLRKEFATAKNLLSLVLERELLREVSCLIDVYVRCATVVRRVSLIWKGLRVHAIGIIGSQHVKS